MEKSKNQMCIGILDSGIGGLTVAREIDRLMPMESILYYGDNANCPYGNRSKDEILELSLSALDFLQERDVKIAAVACNTISSLIDQYRYRYKFPIVSIIEAACGYIAGMKLANIGVFATEFTAKEGLYETLINKLNPETNVHVRSNRELATLIDGGYFDAPEAVAEVRSLLDSLLKERSNIGHIVLGCTHYPIVYNLFHSLAPNITFINPALEQAKAVHSKLEELNLLSDAEHREHNIFTNGGTKAIYTSVIKMLQIHGPSCVHIIENKP